MNVNWDGSCHIVIFDDDDKNNKVIKNFSKNFVDMHSHGLKEVIGTELQYIINVGMHEYFAERVRELINPGECVIYKMNNKKFDENYNLVRNTNYSTNIYSLYKRVMKRDPRAIDEIESLEEAKEIIGMMLGNHYMHNTAYEMLKIFGGKQR